MRWAWPTTRLIRKGSNLKFAYKHAIVLMTFLLGVPAMAVEVCTANYTGSDFKTKKFPLSKDVRTSFEIPESGWVCQDRQTIPGKGAFDGAYELLCKAKGTEYGVGLRGSFFNTNRRDEIVTLYSGDKYFTVSIRCR